MKQGNHDRILRGLAPAAMFLCCITTTTHASTDDGPFNECLQVLASDSNVLKGQIWHTTPLDPMLERAESALLYGDKIVRWTDHENANGTRTVVIMERADIPQPEDDPDGFDVFIESRGKVRSMANVSANAFAFSKNSNDGVSGLFWCQWDRIYREWVWYRDNWF